MRVILFNPMVTGGYGMSGKVRRVPVILDAGEIKYLPQEDIRMILRGADELISTGGRSMLAKILKGSKEKKY